MLLLMFAVSLCLTALAGFANAQDDPNDTPLGDVARNLRKKPAPPEIVIDNDNFSKVVEEAESHRSAGTTMTFTLDPGAKNFRVSTPDASCTLSFTAKTSALLADPIMLDELPKEELAKLDGPATIDGDSLQLSIHNGSAWELRELVIGLTIVRTPDIVNASSYYGPAHVVPAVVTPRSDQDTGQKLQDTTILLHVKGSAASLGTALFRTQLNFALFPDQEWHWAIVRAKGVPPQAASPVETSQPPAQVETPPEQPATAVPGSQIAPLPDVRQPERSHKVVQTGSWATTPAPAVAQSPTSNR
jgi:hypothetical protein